MEARKLRSPSHPTVDLPAAIDKARLIYTAYNKSPVHRDALATCIGYSPSSGPALQALASLTAYGLLEKHRKGESAVSQLALDILYPPSEEEFAASVREAALRPTVFGQIEERFGNHIPHEDGVRSLLNRELGFTEKGAQRAATTYVASMKYLETLRDNERSDLNAENVQNPPPSTAGSTAEVVEELEQMASTTASMSVFEFKELTRGGVGGGKTFRLLADDKLSASQWKRVMAHIKIELEIAEEEGEAAETKANELS